MKTPFSSSSADALQREAQAWVVRLASGRASAADGQAFRRWCGQNPEHARAFTQARAVWQALQPAARAALLAGVPGGQASDTGRRARAAHGFVPGRRALLGGAVAAGTAWLALRPPLGWWPGLADWRADYHTATGEQRSLALADGVQVELNTQTRLNVPPAQGAGAGFELLSGEAEFSAPGRPAARPVTVRAGGGRVLAGAARFNIRYTGPDVCVTCLEGGVVVEAGAGGPARLDAAQQLVYGPDGASAPRRADPAEVSAWRRRMLVFNGVPLATVVEELNRYRAGRIVLTSERLGRSLVQAHFSLDRLDEATALIRDVYGASVTELPGGIVLLG